MEQKRSLSDPRTGQIDTEGLGRLLDANIMSPGEWNKLPKCEATHGDYRCYREVGHTGNHYGGRYVIDTLSWPSEP